MKLLVVDDSSTMRRIIKNTLARLGYKDILEGADGVVFVADSKRERLDDNTEMFRLMIENLKDYGVDLSQFPLVLQYNKRDCNPKLEIGEIEKELGINEIPVTESVATEGRGVMKTLQVVSKEIIKHFQIN